MPSKTPKASKASRSPGESPGPVKSPGRRSARRSALSNSGRSPAFPSTHKIIVGIDFGTTFTGASYVSSQSSEISDIIVIGRWPGPTRDTDYVLKTPTRIAYAEKNPQTQKDLWGFQVEPGMKASSWFKLQLDESTSSPEYEDSTLEHASQTGIMQIPHGKTGVDVTADYLSGVYQCVLNVIGKQITPEALHMTPLEFWFTVPAIWSDSGRNLTLEAARRAGFAKDNLRPYDTINLILEPEAAAITALKKSSGTGLGANIKSGEGVLICDCGGGTVVSLQADMSMYGKTLIAQDITTYLVTQKQPELAFEELCVGTGAKCGSTAIDRKFYQLMSTRFGSAFDKLPMKLKAPGSDFMSAFETIKRNFGPSDNKTSYQLPLNMKIRKANPRHFDEDERLVFISKETLISLFDPVVKNILGLVRQQIKDARKEEGKDIIKQIILVGGFGDSEYLFEAFEKEFGSKKIKITVPDNPQAAIVQGAALRGIQSLRSTTRRCRRNYGYECWRPFREGVDSESNSTIHPVTSEKIAYGYVEWFIKKGEKYHENEARSIAVDVDLKEGAMERTDPLLACDLKNPPERADSDDIYEVGLITSDFEDADLSKFRSNVQNGSRHYLSSGYSLEITFGAQEGILKFQGICDGKSIGHSQIDYTKFKVERGA